MHIHEWFQSVNGGKQIFDRGFPLSIQIDSCQRTSIITVIDTIWIQDGHYIYIVIPGSGTGEDVIAPRICVADGESPKYLHKIMDL